MPPETRYVTPPVLAARYGCKAETIIAAIRRGDIAAIDLARPGSRRPRYRISPDAIAAFEICRAARTPTRRTRRPRRPAYTPTYYR